ncbi:hypothetical protein LZC95_34565 [Pendulispora brunnea]|uniref:PEGA domain-containing protein n=1 Tax=Pendulispora brunnea TaxID=2905690 RepID=A0ABZ2K1Z2_9BACT
MTRTVLRLGAALLLLSAPVHAQEDPRTRARTIAGEGDAQFAAGRCDRAIRLWKEADAIFPAPTIQLRVAHCQALLGHVVEASTTLEAIVGSRLASDAPEAFVMAKSQAATELPTLKARIATLTIERRTPRHANIDEVLVDDEKMPLDKASYPIDPGKHRIRIRQGKEVWESSIELQDGEKRTMVASVVLEPAPPPPKPGRTASYILGGTGLALAAVGGILGLTAMGDSDDLTRDCGSNRSECAPGDQSRIDSLKTKALLSDVFLGAGIVTLGVSGYLFWRSTRVEREPPHLRLTVTGTAAMVEGRF